MRPRLFGRDVERRALLDALDDARGPRVFRVAGPAGIGKTALLAEVAQACSALRHPFAWLDPIDGELTRERVLEVVGGLAARQRATGAARRVLIVDDFHFSRGIERWFSSRFLEMDDEVFVVIADRQALSPAWMQGSIASRTLHLGALSAEEVAAFVAARGVPPGQRAAVVDFAEGNPLLASLGADAVLAGASVVRVEDVLARLASGMCAACEDPQERLATAMVMVARASPLEMLRASLDGAMSPEAALRTLLRQSMLDDTPLGLRPHDLARRSVLAHLRVHYPKVLIQATDAVRAWCDVQIATANQPDRWLLDRAFLDRDQPAWQGCFPVQRDEDGRVELARPGDVDAVVTLTRAQLGAETAARVGAWMTRPEARVDVLRDAGAAFTGFGMTLSLDGEALRTSDDPLLAMVAGHLARVDGSRAATAHVLLCRAWSVVGTGQAPSPAAARLLVRMAARLLGAPLVDFAFVDTERPDIWIAWTNQTGIAASIAGAVPAPGPPRTLLAVDLRNTPREVLARTSSGQVGATRLSTPTDDFGALLAARVRDLAARSALTTRECEVLDLLVLGRSSADIAIVLKISPRTVKFHQQNVLQKIGADSRLDLLRLLL